MKYVVFNHEGVDLIFTFPRTIDHDRAAEAISTLRFGSDQNWRRSLRTSQPVSAGFINQGHCHGKSETLKLSSREDVDTTLLQKSLTVF